MKDRADFYLDSDLGQKAVVTEADNGDLYIEGLAADFGMDSVDEAFEPGAFEQAVKDFKASGNMPLLYHHKPSEMLGEVVDLDLRPDGLWMKARIDKPAHNSHPLYDVYSKVKRGTMKGLSVAGRFFRRRTADGIKIYRAGLREISVTPLPVNERTLVGAGAKAFADPVSDLDFESMDTKALLATIEGATQVVQSRLDDEGNPLSEVEDDPADAPDDKEDDPKDDVAVPANDSTDEADDNTEEASESEADEAEAKDEKAVDLDLLETPEWQLEFEERIDTKATGTVSKAWDGRASRFTEQQYRRSCLIKGPTKDQCHLPVREPDGTLNCKAVSAAKGRLNQVNASSAAIAAARRKLETLSSTCGFDSKGD